MNNVLMVGATPDFYNDARVFASAYSYADLFLSDATPPFGLTVRSARSVHHMFEGQTIPITACMLTSMLLGPWGNETGPWTQPLADGRLAKGVFTGGNPMIRFRDMHNNVWLARPTLLAQEGTTKPNLLRGHLVASTINTNGFEYSDPEVDGTIASVAVPFVFAADKVEGKLFTRFDVRNGNALGEMVSYREVQAKDQTTNVMQAKQCLAYLREGLKRVPQGINQERGQLWMSMTPRELVTNIGIMEKRLSKRHAVTRTSITNMARVMEEVSHLMVARLPIAYTVLLAQINSLDYQLREMICPELSR